MSKIGIISGILAAVLVVGSTAAPLPTDAATYVLPTSVSITPQWVNTSTAQAGISALGRTLSPSVAVTATNSNYSIIGTLFLEMQSGDLWISVTSWSVTGTGRLREIRNYTGAVGSTYRARFVVHVAGERVERASSSIRL